KNPLPAEYARYGSFDQLDENNIVQLNELITSLAATKNELGSVAQKIGDFYNTGMDTVKIEQQGAAPIAQELKEVFALKNKSELTGYITKKGLEGSSIFFGIFGEADPQDSKMTIAWVYQTGLGIGDRDYYLLPEMSVYRDGYVKLLTTMFQISGYANIAGFAGKENEMATKVLAFETELAKIFMDKNILRDPQIQNNITSIEDFQKLLPIIDVKKYLSGLGLGSLKTVNLATLQYIKGLNQVLTNVDINVLKAYLAWDVISSAAPYLSDSFVTTSFDFYGRVLSGKEEQQPRWKRVVNTVDGSLGEAVGKMYVEKYFPADAKERMLTLVHNLSDALKDRINGNTWMTQETKVKAIEKLDAFHVKIGYPEKWRDYSKLEIKNDSYYTNIQRASKFETAYTLSKIGQPVDPEEWQMTPQTVNAYYNPTTNEICFPAGILQPPFFDKNADDAVNYGAIGVVIGHEMSHGFDDQGRQYDKDGNLKDWWNEDDAKSFDVRKKVLVDWFDNIVVLQNDEQTLKGNGTFTLGENIADNGGLNISYLSLQKAKKSGNIKGKMDGYTPEQRFFLAYALVWAANIRDAEIVRRTKSDPHSLGKWRVNGTLPHIGPFYDAFNVKEGNNMYLAPENRAEIW
ncbi:MAG: M13 family metallopeptidase, partial [Bacteroidales bacterium]|nr:M13 family metallopeptidase [Bacteroidales bacterium]